MEMGNGGVGEKEKKGLDLAKASVTKEPTSVLSTSSMAPGSPFTISPITETRCPQSPVWAGRKRKQQDEHSSIIQGAPQPLQRCQKSQPAAP